MSETAEEVYRMPVFLTACLLLSAILFLTDRLKDLGNGRNGSGAGAVRIGAVCALFGAVLIAGAAALGFTDDFLSAVVLILLLTVGWLVWKGISRRRRDLSVPAVVLLAVYLVALLWITLFSRDGTSNTKVLFSFGKIGRFLQTGELGEFRHVMLNVLMFAPLGFLLPRLCRDRLNRFLCVLAVGLWLTATVESLQYLFVIGQCDLEDIIGNTLGTAVGYGLNRLYLRIR